MAKELYVGNLSYETNEEDLRRLFAVAGKVTSVHIITDPVTGASKGCAYVRMASIEETMEAINSLDEALLDNRIISVSVARPQKPQGRPSGGDKGKSRTYGRSGQGSRKKPSR
ncbi:MAG: RNA-binding protein [Geobacteraceae bacterium]|nr:RNA-binding protein [Geobacteraceae bacterium]